MNMNIDKNADIAEGEMTTRLIHSHAGIVNTSKNSDVVHVDPRQIDFLIRFTGHPKLLSARFLSFEVYLLREVALRHRPGRTAKETRLQIPSFA